MASASSSNDTMNISRSTITLTFGDQAENHKGMQIVGSMVDKGHGFNRRDLEAIKRMFKNATIHDLKQNDEQEDACLLVVKGGIQQILEGSGYTYEQMFEEQASLDVDKKAFMYGRVVNKSARWNLCFDDESQEPDYENKKGRIIAMRDMPITNYMYGEFEYYFGVKALGLKGEGNYYYDVKKCGIGFHGDSERRKVVAFRLGAGNPIHYQWFKDGEAVGERMIFDLEGGDLYVMSEKAVGTDWKRSSIYTLRHATGSKQFTTIKE